MSNITKEDIKQEVFDLYDDYAHNRVNRRDFVQSITGEASNLVYRVNPSPFLYTQPNSYELETNF